MDESGKIACLICCICFILPTILIPIGLCLQSIKPRCYINDFYAPALNTHIPSNATSSNTFIFFDLQLRNMMEENSLRYGDLNLTLFYGLDGNIPVANYTVPGFKQGKKNTNDWRDVVETHGLPWDDAIKVVSNGSKVVFRADLVADVKLKQMFWSKKKKIVLKATVEVDGSGEKVHGKPIRLKSFAY
ncbi:protein NDR1-like [Olea europaea var. sylvestris]|uniref:protein NDR1-like n=1 Tax=Olea europaea var. sylvestris TaxID=158386 RepID=UPI000C1D0C70|nr:protein NDR1-like [Olea europaea var. sylvestris]